MCPHSTSGQQRPTGSVTARADAEVCSVKSSCWLRGGRELEMHFCLLSLPLPSSLHPTSSSPPSLLLSLLPIPSSSYLVSLPSFLCPSHITSLLPFLPFSFKKPSWGKHPPFRGRNWGGKAGRSYPKLVWSSFGGASGYGRSIYCFSPGYGVGEELKVGQHSKALSVLEQGLR